jgi:protein phosphatase
MLKRFLSIKCKAYGLTDTGLSRKHNEDNIRQNKKYTLYLLADGMGGHQAGEVASKMAIALVEKALIEYKELQQLASHNNDVQFNEVSAVTEAIQQANIDICEVNKKRGLTDGNGMGTTLVGCWYLADQKMSVIFNVGDSRAYSYYKKQLNQLSTDHSLLQLWKDKCFDGEMPSSNVLTKALGPFPEVVPEVNLYPAKKGEKLLLCSDGLTTMVDDADILKILIEYENSSEKIPEQLINAANSAGGEDNISTILIEFS